MNKIDRNKIPNINSLTLEEKVGQMLMFAFRGTEYNEQLETQIKELKVGGVIHFGHNIKDIKQVKKLNLNIQENANIPMFIGIDEEGGTVQRIVEGMPPFPGAMAVSASKISPYELCKVVGMKLKQLGFNMNFAPVGDVNNNPNNPVINSRSYSDDPKVCSKYVIDSFKGFQDGGVLPTCKHFPGHGDTSVDSHVSLPTVNKDIETLSKIELVPFMDAINAGIDGIMASHILYPSFDNKYPATLSKKIINDLLKVKMGFEGLIVTDSLTMGAIHQNYTPREIVNLASNAGIDLMIFCGKADINDQKEIYNALLEEVKSGKIPMERIDESVSKILQYKLKYVMNENSENVDDSEFYNIGKDISRCSITKVFGDLTVNKDEKILVIFPKIQVLTLVDNQNQNYISLGTVLKNKFNNVDEVIVDSKSINIDEIIKEITYKTKDYDKIIISTINVSKDDYFVKIVNSLNEETLNKTIITSLRSPYDITYLQGVNSYYCLYEPTLLAFESFTECLLENKFKGVLPVKL